MPYDASYHLLYRVDKVRAIVRRERPDVLEIHSPYVAAVAALGCPRSSYGVRTFVWHSDFVDTYRAVFERRAPWAGPAFAAVSSRLWAWARHIAQGCGRTFVASAFLAEKLRAHGLPRVECLPFGVDKTLFSPALRTADARAALSARWGIAPEVPLVALIGRFAVEKHTDLTLRAFARVLRRATPRPHLIAYGDGPERAALEALVGRDPLLARHVHFAGFETSRVRLARDLANVDVLLHACPYETFGLGVAEALATGVGAVLPNAGGTATWTALPSVASYPPLDEHALTEGALAQLARTPEHRRSAGEATRAAIASERDHFVALCDQYEDLLARHRHQIR
jgi:alpha-1,6-mannosyltransferase